MLISTKAVLGLAALAISTTSQAAPIPPDGCGHARGQRGGTIAFERAHPNSGGEHSGFWGGWKGLADGCATSAFGWDRRYFVRTHGTKN
jgi:hypothetical protein